jgi:hypothetical protein
MMTTWIESNLVLLGAVYPDLETRVEGGVQWVRIPRYPVPEAIWSVPEADLAFRIPGNAGEAPYGFWVHPGLSLRTGGAVANYSYPIATPWGADWGQFSFQPEETWQPKAEVTSGVNMVHFARGIADRLSEGA